MFPPLDESEIRLILSASGLTDIGEIKKLPIVFSNDVYEVSGKYIVKFGKSEADESMLRKEVYFSELFKTRIPTAKIILYDFDGHSIPRPFIVYQKVEGRTLFDVWHELTPEARRAAILTLAQYLHIINETPYREYIELFNIDIKRDWSDVVTRRIEENARVAKNRAVFTLSEVELLDRYVLLHKDVLKVSRMALTYYDPRFDNFIVDERGKIIAILDLERTDFYSIDAVLDLIRRMVEHPEKYASEQSKEVVVEHREEYKDLLIWMREGYPELFSFPDTESRLSMYALDYDLQELMRDPDSQRAKNDILKTIGIYDQNHI